MNKTGKDIQTFALLAELQQLRKGRGLSPWKLRDAFELKKIIAKRLNLTAKNVSVQQAYSYLLYEINELGEAPTAIALRHAYAIGQEKNPRTLTDRRLDLAVQLRRHPDTIKAYENAALQTLAHNLYYTSETAVTAPVPAVAMAGVPFATQDKEQVLRKIAADSLAGIYDLGPHHSEILRGFGRNTRPYLNVDIESSFGPSRRGDGWYSFTSSFRFQSTKEVFRVGITSSPHDTGLLMASGLIDEVMQLSTSPEYDHEMPSILRQWRLLVSKSDEDRSKTLYFNEISAAERHALLEPIWQIKADDCRIIEVRIPDQYVAPSVMYELHTNFDLPIREHYAYWEAPGLTYLNTINIDISRFPNRDKWQFFIKPFLGTVFPATFASNGDRFSLPANSWVTHGHGVAVIWQEADA